MTSTTLTKGGGVAPYLAGTPSGSKASARKRAGVASSRSGEKSGEGKKRVRDDRVAAAIFLIPTFVGFFVFYVYPALRGLWYSFTDFNLIGDAHYVGLDNYAKAIGDKEVWNAFAVTIAYALYNIIGQTFLGLLLAALMQRFARSTWVRSLLLLPWLVPNVAIALIWGWLLDSNIGYVTHLLSYLGIDGVTFYNAHAAMPIVAGINIWAYTGYTALLLYAGMLQIPGELYESAALDGAGETRMFFSITLPLLRPVLVLVLVMGLIGSFQIFDTVQIGYAGHPIPAVRVIYYYIYQQGFTFLKMGYASAIAMLLVLVLAVFTAIQLRLMRAGSSDLA